MQLAQVLEGGVAGAARVLAQLVAVVDHAVQLVRRAVRRRLPCALKHIKFLHFYMYQDMYTTLLHKLLLIQCRPSVIQSFCTLPSAGHPRECRFILTQQTRMAWYCSSHQQPHCASLHADMSKAHRNTLHACKSSLRACHRGGAIKYCCTRTGSSRSCGQEHSHIARPGCATCLGLGVQISPR